MKTLDWTKLLNPERRKTLGSTEHAPAASSSGPTAQEHRSPFERDYDRILFSTPVRRLADKTQVFPLEKHDSVRTRLTHSHEVSNLARSIGTRLVRDGVFDFLEQPMMTIPPILAAAGLAHDLGNPPFGHQGEHAIRSWFRDNPKPLGALNDKELAHDFTVFEGNAQMLRLLTRLQLKTDNYGLDLTCATLAALIKYPISSWKCKQAAKLSGGGTTGYTLSTKKPGFFASEAKIVKEIWAATGLSEGQRHPLAYLMEACDDIAYSICDIEDAVKKSLVSFRDIVDALALPLSEEESNDIPEGSEELLARVVKKAEDDYVRYRTDKSLGLTPAELNVIATEKLRVYTISEMVIAASNSFKSSLGQWDKGQTIKGDLLDNGPAGLLRDRLKSFAQNHAYNHRAVLEVEQLGYRTIRRLMTTLWDAIEPDEKTLRPPQKYVHGIISENYRRAYSHALKTSPELPTVYHKLRLLTDMVSGMTDRFALSLLDHLAPIVSE